MTQDQDLCLQISPFDFIVSTVSTHLSYPDCIFLSFLSQFCCFQIRTFLSSTVFTANSENLVMIQFFFFLGRTSEFPRPNFLNNGVPRNQQGRQRARYLAH